MNFVLTKSILKTLAFFDIGNYPLTAEELFAYLWQPPKVAYEDFLKYLEELAAQGIVATHYSYYFLPGRQDTVEARRRALVITEQKLKIAYRAAKKLRSIPFLKAIFVANSVGFEQARVESDIDFFIITESKRIWIVRFFANLILRLYGLRTHGRHLKDRICLCFFADAASLDFGSLRIVNDDVYLAYWFHRLMPLYDPDNYHRTLIESNPWVLLHTPHIQKEYAVTYRYRVGDSPLGRVWKKMWQTAWQGGYGDLVEHQVKVIQWQKIRLSLKEKAETGDKGVILNDRILKFHEHDRRQWFYEQWQEKLRAKTIVDAAAEFVI